MSFFALSWPALIVLLAMTAILFYVAVRVIFIALGIVWRALIYGMESVIEAAGPAIGGFFVQIGAIGLCAAGSGMQRAWAPVQARINVLGARAGGEKPVDTPAIADEYAEAVAVLGLPKQFTQEQVEDHWKRLARPNHVDVTQGISLWIATRINTARDTIFKHHGWK